MIDTGKLTTRAWNKILRNRGKIMNPPQIVCTKCGDDLFFFPMRKLFITNNGHNYVKCNCNCGEKYKLGFVVDGLSVGDICLSEDGKWNE